MLLPETIMTVLKDSVKTMPIGSQLSAKIVQAIRGCLVANVFHGPRILASHARVGAIWAGLVWQVSALRGD